MVQGKIGFVERLFAEHRSALQGFFYRRIRIKSDAADLAQEVYLRMLRINEPELIRNPEHYLYTVAANLIKEHGALESRRAREVNSEEPAIQPQLGHHVGFDQDIDAAQLATRLHEVVRQLPTKFRAAVILQYRYGLSYDEIAEHLGISSHTVKKYLTQALAHCRRRMARNG
jgi:RNA polymerase sigma factor (sigma-70 family)